MTRFRMPIAVAWGAFVGGMTFGVRWLEGASFDSVIGVVKMPLMVLILPGLFGSAIVGSLGAGAVINALVNFAASWLVLYLLSRFGKGHA